MLSPSFLIMFSSSVAASVRGITVHCCVQIVGKGVILVGAFCVKLSYAPNRLSSFCRKLCSFSGSSDRFGYFNRLSSDNELHRLYLCVFLGDKGLHFIFIARHRLKHTAQITAEGIAGIIIEWMKGGIKYDP